MIVVLVLCLFMVACRCYVFHVVEMENSVIMGDVVIGNLSGRIVSSIIGSNAVFRVEE